MALRSFNFEASGNSLSHDGPGCLTRERELTMGAKRSHSTSSTDEPWRRAVALSCWRSQANLVKLPTFWDARGEAERAVEKPAASTVSNPEMPPRAASKQGAPAGSEFVANLELLSTT